jgi:hypothetical protein
VSGNPFGGAGGPRPRDGDHDLCGVYYGIVTQNDDPPPGPGGRVKVRFPWMPEGERDGSHWAPVCVPMAGAGYGTYFIPEVEDVVYVMFIAGDISAPVVVGGAWNAEADEGSGAGNGTGNGEEAPRPPQPPEANEDGKNDFRLIKSRSGHRLLFDDTDQTKLIVTDRKDENYVALGPHAKAGQSAKNTYEVAAPPGIIGTPTEGVSFGALKGSLNILCPSGKLTIKGGTHVEITASASGDIKANGSLNASCGSKANLISKAAGKYNGSEVRIGAAGGGSGKSAPRAAESKQARAESSRAEPSPPPAASEKPIPGSGDD